MDRIRDTTHPAAVELRPPDVCLDERGRPVVGPLPQGTPTVGEG